MQADVLISTDTVFLKLATFPLSGIVSLLAERKIGLFIVLPYIKARDWPWKGQSLNNEPVTKFPMVWALFTSDGNKVTMKWDIHPTKCFPERYNKDNPWSSRNRIPIIKVDGATLAGCSRTFVTLSNRRYEVFEKTPEYCGIFGLPDDCFDPSFEGRMFDTLLGSKGLEIWCFEKTDYIHEHVEPVIGLHYMKGEFLPPRYYMYVDTTTHFLKAIYSSKELDDLSSEIWYSVGKELIEDMNLDNEDDYGFRFEEQATYHIKKGLIHEFVRLGLLLINKDLFSSFESANAPSLSQINQPRMVKDLQDVIETVRRENILYLSQTMSKYKRYIDSERLKNSRMMVMDVEFIHVPYPTDLTRSFVFPCIFSSVVWEGVRHGLVTTINVFPIPCHLCEQPCKIFKQKFFNFDCLFYGFDFIEQQASLIERMLMKYDNFRIYTYGRGDAFQLEQGRNFFSDSFEQKRYERRNRRRTQRIVDITKDLSVEGKSLEEIEKGVLQPWLIGWSRKEPKVNVNSRFMTRYGTAGWASRYSEAVNSCSLDTISTFLFLLHTKYKA